jgi:iron complex transport system substrate-binding protein
MALAACGDDDDGDANGNGNDSQTITVTDLLGREVEVPSPPRRVVALSPTAVEFVYAVGGEVVGRAETALYPPGVEEVDAVGPAYQPNLEAILALNPDLIVADSIIHSVPQLRSAVEGLGSTVVFAGASSYDDAVLGLELMGRIFGQPDAADERISEIEASLAEAQAMIEGRDVSAIVVIADRDRVVYAANRGSYPGDLLHLLGVENPFHGQPDSGPFPGFSTTPPDLLLSADPDYILTLSPAPPPAPRLSQVLGLIGGLDALSAIQEGRVVELDVELLVQASGPRAGQALLSIAEALSAD